MARILSLKITWMKVHIGCWINLYCDTVNQSITIKVNGGTVFQYFTRFNLIFFNLKKSLKIRRILVNELKLIKIARNLLILICF